MRLEIFSTQTARRWSQREEYRACLPVQRLARYKRSRPHVPFEPGQYKSDHRPVSPALGDGLRLS